MHQLYFREFWLAALQSARISVPKYLDAEGEREDVRPPKDGDDADAGEDGDGTILVGALGLLRQVRRRIVPVQGVLAHQEGQDDGVGAAADPGHLRRRLEMGEHVRRRLRGLGHQREHHHDDGAADHLQASDNSASWQPDHVRMALQM